MAFLNIGAVGSNPIYTSQPELRIAAMPYAMARTFAVLNCDGANEIDSSDVEADFSWCAELNEAVHQLPTLIHQGWLTNLL